VTNHSSSGSSAPPLDLERVRLIPAPSGATSTGLQPHAPSTLPQSTSAAKPAVPDFLPTLLQAEIQRIARLSDDEAFEDGVETELSRGASYLLERYGAHAARAMSDLYLAGLLKPVILSELLPWLGRADETDSIDHETRFWLLVYSLRDSHPFVRSGAALGLAALGDRRAVPYLRREAQTESIGLLRDRLISVADELSV
jgi:hypothetical protein